MKLAIATVRQQFLAEKAYIGNFWAGLSSTALYVITNLVFLDLLFKRTGDIAGYSKNDFFFMMFVGQFTFYLTIEFIVGPMELIIDSVRKGFFDLVLLKPIAIRTYLYARAIRPLSFLIVSMPNFILFGFIINWSELNLNWLSVLSGAVVWLSGFIITNTILFSLTVQVFVQGDSTDLLKTYFYSLGNQTLPYGKLPGFVKFLSFAVFPSILMTAGVSAVMLMKISPYYTIATSIVAGLISLYVLSLLWKFALRNYTSASS